MEFFRSEMHDCDWNARRRRCDGAPRGIDRRSAGSFPRDDDEARASRGPERLAPRSGRKEPRRTGPRIRIHEQDICVPSGTAVLKSVVKDHDIRSLRDCLSDATRAIRRHNHRDACVQALMHDRFVAAISS
jgi:hypothetical protein